MCSLGSTLLHPGLGLSPESRKKNKRPRKIGHFLKLIFWQVIVMVYTSFERAQRADANDV